jgi:NodT family efflux transporter outer membrane factor (OMF) lipoprotein
MAALRLFDRALLASVLAGCLVGPAYHVPPAPVPRAASYKEATWRVASPGDAIPRGAWWTMFRQPELDALQRRLNITNQTLVAATQNYLAARAQVRVAEAQYFPTVTADPSASHGRLPGVIGVSPNTVGGAGGVAGGGGSARGPFTAYIVSGQASWAPDLFGRVRYTVRQRAYTAQALAADLESTRLLVQSELAQTYFQLRAQDALQQLLDQTVAADQEILEQIRLRFAKGLENESTLVQAEQTLEAAQVQATNAGVLRAEYEHAIATLIGVPATDFSLPRRALLASPPAIPIATPSQLLERRPDVAAAERRMAAANAAIGYAETAYFPDITLRGTAGFASSALHALFSWPSRLWSVGGDLAETLFDGGARRANVESMVRQYNAAVASYRETVLVAFQQVEDMLAAIRILADAIERQRRSVELAERALDLERQRYEAGLDPYITLMTQQTVVLGTRQLLVTLQVQQMVAAVALVQALGGGWDRTELPPP